VIDGGRLLESLDRHFMAGCPALSGPQFRSHQATGTCPQCRAQAAEVMADAELDAVLARVRSNLTAHVAANADPVKCLLRLMDAADDQGEP